MFRYSLPQKTVDQCISSSRCIKYSSSINNSGAYNLNICFSKRLINDKYPFCNVTPTGLQRHYFTETVPKARWATAKTVIETGKGMRNNTALYS